MVTFNNLPFSDDGKNAGGEVVDIAILGVPSDIGASTSGGGMATAPTAIRNSYYAENMNYGRLRCVDVGDAVITARSIRTVVVDIAMTVANLVELGVGTTIVLGGDDSINYGVLKGLLPNKTYRVVHLDAHDDCYTDVDAEDDLDHASWVRKATEDFKNIPNFTQFGVRTPVHNIIETVTTHTGSLSGISIARRGKEGAATVVCIDMDVVDPAYAPGVGTAEPGGVTSRELLDFCYYLGTRRSVEVLSFTEVCPAKDINNCTSRLVFRCILNYIRGYAGSY